MKLLRKVGSTSQIFQIFIADSSSTTGAGLTGLTNASGSLTAYYHRDTDTTATVINLVTMTVGTFTSSGFKEIDATNMPGWYQFCPPNAALASGAASVAFHLKGAVNMAPLPVEVDLDAQVDVTFWNGTVVKAPTTAGVPEVCLTDAVSHGGTLGSGTATLALSRMNVTSQTVNTAALTVLGNGTGPGGSITGGAGNSNGMSVTGSGTGSGLVATGGASGGAASAGIFATGGGGNAYGIVASATGTSHGLFALSGTGATGNGIQATAQSSNGNGFSGTGTGTANGMLLTGGNGTGGDGLHCVGGSGASVGIRGIGGGTSGAGIIGTGTAGNSPGIEGDGQGSAAGMALTGGATGAGLALVGGGTSGDALIATATSGHGFNVTATGTAKDALHLTGAAAATTNAGGHGINATGGAATISAGGTAGVGLNLLGGAGAASTNGAGDGFLSTGGGTTTVSGGSGMTLAHSGSKNDFNATTTPLVLAKTSNITGFNDITAAAAATGVWQDATTGDFTVAGSIGLSFGGSLGTALFTTGKIKEVTLVDTVTTVTNQLTAAAIATGVWTDTTAGDFTVALSVGKSVMNGVTLGTGLTVARCTLVDTLTTYTGNTVQTGDSFARIGAAGVGLTNLGDARIAHLDADVSSRMATYTQPTGFLAATFPSGTIANTTNITAGTVTTATNVTTVNGLAANVITATSINADAITAAKIADGAIDRATFAADTGLQAIRSSTAASATGTTIVLDASASAVDNFYNWCSVFITGGTGVGQVREILGYVGSTKTATVRAWTTNPDNTSTFAIRPAVSAWDDVTASHLTSGSTGASLNAAGSAGDPWSTSLPGAYGAGTAGFIVGTNLDATVSSRASSATALSTAQWTNTLATNMGTTNTTVAANLDAAVSSRMATYAQPTGFLAATFPSGTVTNNTTTPSWYTAPGTAPTTAQIATAVWTDLLASSDFSTVSSIGKLLKDDIDAAVSSRAASATALSTAQWTNTLATNLGTTNATVALNLDAAISSRQATFTAGTGIVFPSNFAALGISAGGKVTGVVLVDTLTTYTGDTPQTGDSFSRIGATGSGLTSLAPAADMTKVRAAVYDTATGSGGDTLTLSNGATQTINLTTGTRTTAP